MESMLRAGLLFDRDYSKITILHLITDLFTGGAEMMLYKLMSATDRRYFNPVVVSLMDYGILGKRIEALGVPIYAIGMSQGRPNLYSLWRLVRLVYNLRPALIQGWMYHANLAALFASRFTRGHIPVLWNIRQSLYDINAEKRMTAMLIRLSARLSLKPRWIIYNSSVSANQHEQMGFAARRREVIPNGFDCDIFKPSISARYRLRKFLNLDEKTTLIGLIGRYHPMKDHANFLRAAKELVVQYPDVHFILAGRDVDETNTSLTKIVKAAGLTERVHLLGERTDIPEITAGLDIASSSSYGEGFPNVIGEAMACGVPCVVTDVGDSAWLVSDTGIVVPPRDPYAMAKAWAKLIDCGFEGRTKLGWAGRNRIISYFSLKQITQRYEALYKEALNMNTCCGRE